MTRHLFFAASILCIASAATAVAGRQTKADEAISTAAKDDERDKELGTAGKNTTDELCTQCHGIEDVTSNRRTPREWNDVVAEMMDRGASGTPEQVATVKRYLTRYYGSVRVNTASAADLSSVLGLSSKDADNVVEYRKAHGNFADAAALAKVPDIDKTKIDAQPAALRFD
jgi:DNA uptake protein ComE-like DNA-binding protein